MIWLGMKIESSYMGPAVLGLPFCTFSAVPVFIHAAFQMEIQ